MTMLEDLPSTVLLDILEYLSPIDRYRAMHNLNYRLNGIVRHGTTHINLSNIRSKDDFDYHLKYILPDIINNLCFLKISNDFIFDKEQISTHNTDVRIMFGIIKKIQAKIDLTAYKKLKELQLVNVTGAQLELVSDKLAHMSHMKRLIISFRGTSLDAFKSIFNNSVIRSILTNLTLTLTDANVTFPSLADIPSFTNLEYLTLESCRIPNLAIMCPTFENIKYLDVSIWDFPNTQQSILTEKFHFPNLINLRLKVDEIGWSFVEHFLKECGEKLTCLTFTGHNNMNFISPEIWQTLITNHLTHLIKFQFQVTLWESWIDKADLIPFNTDFWHQLNVYVACDLDENASEEDGSTIHVYTVPFCNSSLVTSPSAVSIIAPSTIINAPYKKLQNLIVILDKKPSRSLKRFYENAESIVLESMLGHYSNILPFIRASVNPENICHLGFQSIRAVLTSEVFMQLLEQCPNIYSLNLHSSILVKMTNRFSNEKICLLLQKMIKQIQFKTSLEQEDFDRSTMQNFIQTFTNLECLYIHMGSSENIMIQLPIMIDRMKVLNKIFIKNVVNIPNGFIEQIKNLILDLKESYIRKEKFSLVIWR